MAKMGAESQLLGHQGNCHCRRGKSLSGAFGGDGAIAHYPPNLEIEPMAIKIWAKLDLAQKSAEMRVITTVVGRVAGVRTLTLDGVSFEDVDVKDISNLPLTWSYDGAKIKITWEESFLVDEYRMVEVRYRVHKPVSGLFFMQPTIEDPHKPLYAATDHETELARYWLACIDLPNVRTSLEFHLTAAADLTILANGHLICEEVNNDGTKTALWRLEQRCPSYLVCFAVGDFVRFNDVEFEGIPLAYYGCKDFTSRDLERTFGRTRSMLTWITAKLGVPFPFPKYYQFALPEFGGAMENVSLVSWSDHFIQTERTAPEGTWLVDQVNVHEMAHAYFGDLVVCRDFAHAWLKESWATYMETCWLEDQKGSDEQLYDLFCNARAYFTEADDNYARPLVTRKFTSSWQMYDRHLYPGGACRLHTLRWELGDTVFWRAVTDYLETHREQVVETQDWQRMLEKHSGRALQQLFDQWIYSPGYPDIKVTFSYDDEKKLSTFEIVQKQVDEKKGIPAFVLTTELGWTIAGESHLRVIKLSAARHTFEIPMASDPEQVRFDPRGRVLHKLEFDPGEAKLKKQLTQANDVIGRIHAARQLSSSGKRKNIQAVVEAYRNETFWGVRKEILKALAEINSADSVRYLCDFVDSEHDALVLPEVFHAASLYRDAQLQQAIENRLAIGDLGPQAVAAAFAALAAQRQAAPLDLLRAAAERADRTSGIEQSAALKSLGATRMEELAPALINATQIGRTPYRARDGAVKGLAQLVPYVTLPTRSLIIECCRDLLRDPEPSIRLEAARTLKVARAHEEIPNLEAFRATLPLQQKVVIDHILADLRRHDQSEVKGLQRQLEELQGKIRKLSERVQELEDKG